FRPGGQHQPADRVAEAVQVQPRAPLVRTQEADVGGGVDLVVAIPDQAVVLPAVDNDVAADGIDSGRLGEYEPAGLDEPCALHRVRRLPVEHQGCIWAPGVNLHLPRPGNGSAIAERVSAVVELEGEVSVDDGNGAAADRVSE